VTRQEVGRIQVTERETRVEIASRAAARFAEAARHPGEDDEGIRIEPLHGARFQGGGGRATRRQQGADRQR
jgi:ATP-dependent RNA helicase DeaD